MGSSSSSSSCSTNENPNLEANERFHFRFTDCSCQCDASKRHVENNNLPQAAFLTALMTQMNRSQYDIRCDCDCGEGVKMGFLFGNTSSKTV